MTYSVQQIKFEFISYIKEFGASADGWRVGTCDEPDRTLFATGLVDRERDIWLWKPALAPAAAAMVRRYFVGLGVTDADDTPPGRCVYLVKASGRAPARAR